MEGFVYRDLAPRLGHVGRARRPRGAGAHDPDPEAVGLDIRNAGPTLGDGEIAQVALEPADGNRFQRLAHDADALALGFLRADPAANGRQKIGPGYGLIGRAEILGRDPLNEAGDVDVDRTARDADRVRT